MRYALIDLSLGKIVNVVEIEPNDGSKEPAGFIHVQSDDAAIGDDWDGQQIVKAAPVDDALAIDAAGGAVSVDMPTTQQQIDDITARVAQLVIACRALGGNI